MSLYKQEDLNPPGKLLAHRLEGGLGIDTLSKEITNNLHLTSVEDPSKKWDIFILDLLIFGGVGIYL